MKYCGGDYLKLQSLIEKKKMLPNVGKKSMELIEKKFNQIFK